jgi:hypothetical protein
VLAAAVTYVAAGAAAIYLLEVMWGSAEIRTPAVSAAQAAPSAPVAEEISA